MHPERRLPLLLLSSSTSAPPGRRRERHLGDARVPATTSSTTHRDGRPPPAELDCDDQHNPACPFEEESGPPPPPPPRRPRRRSAPRRRTSNRSRTTAIPRKRSSTTSPAPPRSRWGRHRRRGLCTTSTPLSSARRPRGVVFAECVPLARRAARTLLPTVDAVVALTHQTLPEDARLAEEVPEIAAILGGHEHTPFAGRMGHGANAAAVLASKGVEATTSECVHPEAGTLCARRAWTRRGGGDDRSSRGPGVGGHPRPPSATLGKDAVGVTRRRRRRRSPQRRPPPPRRRLRAPRERITTSSVTEVCGPPRVSTRTRSGKKTK